MPGGPATGETAWLRATIEGGGVVALAGVSDGTAAGAGACSAPVDGSSESAGLAVTENQVSQWARSADSGRRRHGRRRT